MKHFYSLPSSSRRVTCDVKTGTPLLKSFGTYRFKKNFGRHAGKVMEYSVKREKLNKTSPENITSSIKGFLFHSWPCNPSRRGQNVSGKWAVLESKEYYFEIAPQTSSKQPIKITSFLKHLNTWSEFEVLKFILSFVFVITIFKKNHYIKIPRVCFCFNMELGLHIQLVDELQNFHICSWSLIY